MGVYYKLTHFSKIPYGVSFIIIIITMACSVAHPTPPPTHTPQVYPLFAVMGGTVLGLGYWMNHLVRHPLVVWSKK